MEAELKKYIIKLLIMFIIGLCIGSYIIILYNDNQVIYYTKEVEVVAENISFALVK